jgi:transposase
MITPKDVLAFEKTVADKKTYRRFLCIKLKIIDGKTQAEIAQHKGFGFRHVQRIQAQVQQQGLNDCYAKPQQGNHRHLSSWQEQAILQAVKGTASVEPIRQALEQAIGRKTAKPYVYCVLKCHGWKATLPRPVNPNHNEEDQRFKKNARIG